MGKPGLAPGDLSELSGYGLGLDRSTPLWYYVLKEAEVVSGGLHLGPVGGRIVAEVIMWTSLPSQASTPQAEGSNR